MLQLRKKGIVLEFQFKIKNVMKIENFGSAISLSKLGSLFITSTTIRGFSEFYCFKQKNSQNTRIVVLVMDSLDQ
jgi:hypothetical protein